MLTRLMTLLAFVAGLAAVRPAVAGAEFINGDLDISVTPASAVVSFAGMMPGDSVEGSLAVENSGSLNLRYAMTSTATNQDGKALKDAMLLMIEDASGTVLYSGDLDSESGLLVGNPASGQQAGDRVLGAGEVEDLTLRVELPLETGNSVEDAESTATFMFTAEEVGGSDDENGSGDDEGETGSPSVATGDSGLRGGPANNKTNPVDPRIPIAVFAAGLTVLIAYARRSPSVEVNGAVKEPAEPADSP